MFRVLVTHPQGSSHKRRLVYCMRVISVGCTKIEEELVSVLDNIPSAACGAPPEDEQAMLETCRGP
jgi:hypothetical protein